jgi:cell division protein ZapD
MNASEDTVRPVIFEHPLNERVRTLLRLEFLFDQARFGLEGETGWHSRTAVGALVDVVQLLSRGDLRSEIQKELERVISTLDALSRRPGVDPGRLDQVLGECRELIDRLRDAPPGIPPQIRDNDLLNTVAQRAGIMGGTCGFDVPAYHLWLHGPAAARREDLRHWLTGFELLRRATQLILRLMRDSADPIRENAVGGSYQASLDRQIPYQLLRVALPISYQAYPEISGNRHFCTIRFMSQPDPTERPRQLDEDVRFVLERCVI